MLKRIALQDAREGMFVHELCGSWLEHSFWKTRFLLDSSDLLKRLIDGGVQEIIIDTDKGLDVATTEVVEDTPAATPVKETASPPVPLSLADESERAIRIKARAKEAIARLFDNARMGKTIETAEAQALVEDIAASISRHPHAFISLVRLKSADDYTWLHSVSVCALMMALGRQLQLEAPIVHELGIAGLFHDLGKVGIPLNILNKPGKLTDEEFEIIKKHPAIGTKLLKESGQVSNLVLDVCLHHHEKIDGTGYPKGLKDEQISLYARMGAICDIYDAVTSDRSYKKGWQPAEAIRKMAEWCSGHLDKSLFQVFVKTIGIYPTGSLVRLASGRLAIVIEQHPQSLLTPKVMVFFSTGSNIPIARETLDLSRSLVNDKIISRENPDTWGFKRLEDLWMNHS